MTDLTPDLVRKVAHLARLKLPADQLERLGRKLGDTLTYVEMLNEVDTTDVEPMAHTVESDQRPAGRRAAKSLPREEALANAPKTDGKYFLVPPILDEG